MVQNGLVIVPDPEIATPSVSSMVPSSVIPAPVSKLKWMVVARAALDVSASPTAATARNTCFMIVLKAPRRITESYCQSVSFCIT